MTSFFCDFIVIINYYKLIHINNLFLRMLKIKKKESSEARFEVCSTKDDLSLLLSVAWEVYQLGSTLKKFFFKHIFNFLK